MILESCLHTRKPRSHAEQLCTPLTETSGATVSNCEGGEKAVDRLLQNLEDHKSSLEYRLQLAQATLIFNFLTRKLQTGPSHSHKSVPNCFACPPFFHGAREERGVHIWQGFCLLIQSTFDY